MKEEHDIKQIDSKNKAMDEVIKYKSSENYEINENSKNDKMMNKETDSIKQKQNTSKKEQSEISYEIRRYENKNEDKNSNTSQKSNEMCCSEECLGIFFLVTTILLSVSIIPNAILIVGLSIAIMKNEECKAELYKDINLISAFEGMIILFSLSNQICGKKKDDENESESENDRGGSCLRVICPIISRIIAFGLSMTTVIYTQINYNKTTTWENCGSIKGWIIYGLVINYIEVITNSIGFIFALILIFILICYKE